MFTLLTMVDLAFFPFGATAFFLALFFIFGYFFFGNTKRLASIKLLPLLPTRIMLSDIFWLLPNTIFPTPFQKIIRLHIHSNKRTGTRFLRQGTLGSAALLLMFSEQLKAYSPIDTYISILH